MSVPAAEASGRGDRLGRADLLLGIAVFLARVPFLGPGYGADPDAWRVAWTGLEIARRGAYQSSRAPGNPLPEFAAALLSGAPPWTLNALSALFGAFAVMLFGLLLRRLGGRAWLPGAIALAFTPVLAIHSADAMDYVWALAFVLAAWLAAMDARAATAGVLVGLAAGCRLTSLVMLVPLSVLLAPTVARTGRSPLGALGALWAIGLATAAAAFAPVIATYGTGFLRAYDHGYPPLLYVAKNLSVDVWGVPGCVALAWALARVVMRRGRTPADGAITPGPGAAPWIAAALAVAIALAMFLRLPHEAAYLIPAVPFVLVLLARALSRREAVALAAALVLSSLLFKVSEPGKPDSPPPGPLGRVVHAGGRALQLDVLRGPILHERARRERGVRYAESVRRAALAWPGPTVVVAYEWLPFLRVLARGSSDGPATYVYLLDRAELDRRRAEGATIRDLPGAEGETWLMHGYGLHEAGSRPLTPIASTP